MNSVQIKFKIRMMPFTMRGKNSIIYYIQVAEVAAKEHCCETLFNCVQIIANLAILLYPFLPFSSEKISNWLGTKNEWVFQSINAGHRLPQISILFEQLDKSIIDEEIKRDL